MKYRDLRLSKPKQRLLYLTLSCLAVFAVFRQFYSPLKPRLPKSSVGLPAFLSELGFQPAPQAIGKAHSIFEREYLAGKGQYYVSSDGDHLSLIPLASWMQTSIDPLSVSKALSPPQGLSETKVLTLRRNQLQIGMGKHNGFAAYQGCLMANGEVAIDRQLLAAPKLDFWQKVQNMIWPSSLNSFSCVLITTNQGSLLDGSSLSRAFLVDLTNSIDWPR